MRYSATFRPGVARSVEEPVSDDDGGQRVATDEGHAEGLDEAVVVHPQVLQEEHGEQARQQSRVPGRRRRGL